MRMFGCVLFIISWHFGRCFGPAEAHPSLVYAHGSCVCVFVICLSHCMLLHPYDWYHCCIPISLHICTPRLLLACLLVCILPHVNLGCIAFGMLATLVLCAYLSPIAFGKLRLHNIAFPYCIVFGIHALHCVWFGVSNQTRGTRDVSYAK